MTETGFSDELLMSYVDGEVDADTAGQIEAAMRSDAGLADRVEIFAQTRMLASDALEPLLQESVPAALSASVESMIARHRQAPHVDSSGKVVPLWPRRQSQSSAPAAIRRWAVPLAASIALMIGTGLGGFWLGAYNAPRQSLSLGTVNDPGLSEALRNVASGGEKEIPRLGRFRVVSSFRDRDGGLCREAELNPPQGSALALVACRREGAWVTTFALALSGDDGGYTPASATDALDAYLSSIVASPPLEAAEEKQALNKLK